MHRPSVLSEENMMPMFQKILVGYDGSKGGKAALERAAVAAKHYNAALTILWVREPLPRHSDMPGETAGEQEGADEYFKARQKEVAELAARHDVSIDCETRRGHPAKTIVSFARDGNYDLIVIGHSDHSELWGRLLGDTADRVSDHAHCSVLIVKQPGSPAE
jgi:nucleotide-binding universal stress UspA family protein